MRQPRLPGTTPAADVSLGPDSVTTHNGICSLPVDALSTFLTSAAAHSTASWRRYLSAAVRDWIAELGQRGPPPIGARRVPRGHQWATPFGVIAAAVGEVAAGPGRRGLPARQRCPPPPRLRSPVRIRFSCVDRSRGL